VLGGVLPQQNGLADPAWPDDPHEVYAVFTDQTVVSSNLTVPKFAGELRRLGLDENRFLGPRKSECSTTARELTVLVHNIGARASGPATVRLASAEGKTLATRKIDSLDAPNDLLPRRSTLVFKGIAAGSRVHLAVDPDNKTPEITETNNTVVLVPATLPETR